MQQQLLKKIRILVVFFIIVLALSGITAFPVYTELSFLHQHGWVNDEQFFGATDSKTRRETIAQTPAFAPVPLFEQPQRFRLTAVRKKTNRRIHSK